MLLAAGGIAIGGLTATHVRRTSITGGGARQNEGFFWKTALEGKDVLELIVKLSLSPIDLD